MSYELAGTATAVPGGVNMESVCTGVGAGSWGAVDANVPRNAFDFGDITVLEATFTFTEGTCEAGSPRFSLLEANPAQTVYVNIGPAADPATCPAAPGEEQNTGNMIDPTSPAKRFIVNGVPMTYAEALAALQGGTFTDIFFVVDPSHCATADDPAQRLSVNPCMNVRA